jgi:putative ABC transport system permease protein
MNLLRLSWRNLTYRPLNLLLNLVLLALGVGLISFLFQVSTQLEEKFTKNLAEIDMVVGAKGSPLQLILCSMYHVDAPTGNISLKEARPFLNPNHPLIKESIPLSLGDNYKGYRIVGTDPAILPFYQATIGEGAIWKKEFECVIGADIAKRMGLQIGDTFHSSHGLVNDEIMAHDEHDFIVTGIVERTGSVLDQLILCSTETIWAVHGSHAHEEEVTPEGEEAHDHDHNHDHDHDGEEETVEETEREITSILVRFKGQNFRTLNFARNINENTNLLAATPAIQLNQLYANIGVGEEALRWLALIIILVSGFSLFISMFASLKNRKYELAVMRIMGASPGKVFSLIILEGFLLGLLGAVLGLLLSHAAMYFMADAMQEAYRYRFTAFKWLPEENLVFAGALLIGFIAALIPALQARAQELSKTLSEG